MKTDGIIFDLDGTLWNATEAICETWSLVLKEYPEIDKKITIEELEGCMGLLLSDIGKKLFPNISDEKQKELMKKCNKKENEYLAKNGGRLFDRIEEMLKRLAEKYPLFIVSNCQAGYIEAFLEGHKFGKYFKDFTCPGITGKAKGENIKLIVERNNLKKPVYVGDTISDKKACDIAEVPFIFAEYGFGKVEEYEGIIRKPMDMIELINS